MYTFPFFYSAYFTIILYVEGCEYISLVPMKPTVANLDFKFILVIDIATRFHVNTTREWPQLSLKYWLSRGVSSIWSLDLPVEHLNLTKWMMNWSGTYWTSYARPHSPHVHMIFIWSMFLPFFHFLYIIVHVNWSMKSKERRRLKNKAMSQSNGCLIDTTSKY